MNNIRIIYIALFAVLMAFNFSEVKGQDNNMFYFMNNMPQANLLNPANLTDSSKMIVGIPGLQGINLGINSTFSLSDLVYPDGGDLVVDFDKMYNNRSKVNTLSECFSMPLLTFQLRKEDKIFSFSVTEKQNVRYAFDREGIKFLRDGNTAYMSEPFETEIGVNFLHYRDYSFGYSQKVIPNLIVGGRFKLLTGFGVVRSNGFNIGLETQSEIKYLKLSTGGTINANIPLTVGTQSTIDDLGFGGDDFNPINYAMSFSNLGFGIDLGAQYKITPKIEVSASVIDLGMIGWKSDLNNITFKGEFTWEGIDVTNVVLDENDPAYEAFDDQIDKITDKVMETADRNVEQNSFLTGLPTQIYIGGKYTVNEMFNAGLVDRILIYDGIVNNAITLSGNAQFGKVLSLTAAYSVISNSFANLGLGLALKLGTVEFFLVADNLLSLANVSTAQNLNASVGFNLMFGYK